MCAQAFSRSLVESSPLRSSRAKTPLRILSFSPSSFPTTRISMPTAACQDVAVMARKTPESPAQHVTQHLQDGAHLLRCELDGAEAHVLEGRRVKPEEPEIVDRVSVHLPTPKAASMHQSPLSELV